MGYRVPITIMVDVETLSKEERIKFAKTSTDQELLEFLARDKSPEVRAALFSNENLYFESIVYGVLSKDDSVIVKQALKEYCEKLSIDRECWVVYYSSIKIFGKIPKYTDKEIQALTSFLYFISSKKRMMLEIDFSKNVFYTPYAPVIKSYIERIRLMNESIPDKLIEKIKAHYMSSNKNVIEEINNTYKYLDEMVDHEPFDFITWISALGKAHYYMTYTHPSSDYISQKEKESIIRQCVYDEKLHSLAIDALVENKFFPRH